MAVDRCPDRDTLERMLLGQLPPPQSELVRSHLLRCHQCVTVVERMSVTISNVGNGLAAAGIAQNAMITDTERAARARGEARMVWDRDADEVIDFLDPAERPDEIGRLGGYRVLELLSVGGMGIVFRADDPKLARQVALKTLRPTAAVGRVAKARFLREAQATAAIEHDNIVSIYQVGEDRGVPFIAMQFLRGESLQTRLKREKRLNQRVVARIGGDVATGLAAAHDRNLIHRDIKPANIWLEAGTDRAKIVDFGLVHAVGTDVELTQVGTVLGTPQYMPPEQAWGLPVDHRGDLFSLGVVLYHLLTGAPPFARNDVRAMLAAVVQDDPEPIADHCPGLHPDLRDLVTQMLEKDPDRRPKSAHEVSRELRRIEQALADDRAGQLPAATTALDRSPRPAAARRRRGPYIVGGVTIVLALIFGFLWHAGVLFRVETSDGTILVEIEPADKPIEINVHEDKTVTIKDPNDGNDITIAIDRTKKQLRPTKRGFQMVVASFSLDAQDGRHVNVRFIPKDKPAERSTAVKRSPVGQQVLTVAQDGSGQFTSIGAALEHAQRGATIRVLDDSVYRESLSLSVPEVHTGLTLETPAHATIMATRPGTMLIVTVPGVHIRGFRFRAENVQAVLCAIGFHCAGTIVEDIDCTVETGQMVQGVSVENALNPWDEPPVIIRNSRFTRMYIGVRLRGVATDYTTPTTCRGVMVVNNRFDDCFQSIDMEGELQNVLVAGNRIIGSRLFGLQLEQLVGRATTIVVAHNTFFRSHWPFRVWDDEPRGRDIAVLNNLSLAGGVPDWLFLDNGGSRDAPKGPGAVTALCNLWQFAGNYRECQPPTESDMLSQSWIPPSETDTIASTVEVRSRDPDDTHFLRPATDSPLNKKAYNNASFPLPSYVGAIPPDPSAQWDWLSTWRALKRTDEAPKTVAGQTNRPRAAVPAGKEREGK